MQDRPLSAQRPRSVRAVWAPKVDGAASLQACTAASPVASVIHFSSLSSLLGTAGQGNYAAANAALDEAAAAQQAAGLPAVSVAWGPWAAGMALSDPRIAARFRRAGMGLITPAAGLQALAAALQAGRPCSVAASVDWTALFAASAAAAAAPIFADLRPMAAAADPAVLGFKTSLDQAAWFTAEAAPAAAAPAAIDRKQAQAKIANLVQGLLGRPVAADEPLMEAGLDSLSAVELRNSLESGFSLELPATLMFDYPSIVALAGFVAAKSEELASEQSATRRVTVLGAYPQAAAAAAGLSAAAVAADLQRLVDEMLGAHVPPDAPLMEAGLDSLSAVELRNILAGKYGLELPATLMFDYPSIAALSAYIADAAGDAHSGAAPDATVTISLSPYRQLALDADAHSQQPGSRTTEVIGMAAKYPGNADSAAGRKSRACSIAQCHWSTLQDHALPMKRKFLPAHTGLMPTQASGRAFCHQGTCSAGCRWSAGTGSRSTVPPSHQAGSTTVSRTVTPRSVCLQSINMLIQSFALMYT
jgi:acyl carrier protein